MIRRFAPALLALAGLAVGVGAAGTARADGDDHGMRVHLDVTVGQTHMEGTATRVAEHARRSGGTWQYRVDIVSEGRRNQKTIVCSIAVATPQEAERLRREVLDNKTTGVKCVGSHGSNDQQTFLADMNTISPTEGDVISIFSVP